MQIHRLTTQYVDEHDRIRVSALDAENQPCVLWLTRRLLVRLVPHLCEWVQNQTVHGASGHWLHSFAQAAAAAALPHQEPIAALGQDILVRSIDVQTVQGNIRLTFKGADDDGQPVCTLSQEQLRQWLGILFQQSQLASWLDLPFAPWVSEGGVSEGGVGGNGKLALH